MRHLALETLRPLRHLALIQNFIIAGWVQNVLYDNYYLYYKDLSSRINIIIINNSLLIMTNSLFC